LVCRCRGSPALVVLQEPAEDVDAGEAVANRALAAGRTGKHQNLRTLSWARQCVL
jgi:hypothetical protein